MSKFVMMKKAFALAGSDPTTPEQKTAYRKAWDLLFELQTEEFDLDEKPIKLLPPLFSQATTKVKTVRKISFADLIMNKEYVRFKIVPDSSVRNWRTEDIIKSIADQFTLPIDRLQFDGLRLTGIRIQERAIYEIEFKNGKVCFYLSIPKHISPLIQRRLSSVWDKATIEAVGEWNPFDPSKTVIHELLYKRHDLYSLHTDAKDNLPLSSLLEAGKLVSDDERASVIAFFDPIHQMSWSYQLNDAWNKLRSGRVPKKFNLSFRNVFRSCAVTLGTIIQELVLGISEIFSSGKENNIYANKPIDPNATQFTIDQLSQSTKQKVGKAGIKTYLWTMAESEDPSRAELISKTLASAFSDLTGDNELEAKRVNTAKKTEILKTITQRTPPKVNIRYNIMSTAEASKIVQLAGAELQEQYPEIIRIDERQIDVSNNALKDPSGILVGEVTFKGETENVYQPTTDEDEVCLPHVGIGGMGQGKTRGLLANYALESILKGYGALAIDPAKRQIGDELAHAVKKGVLREDQFVRMDLGKEIFALDFCEALHDDRAKARLANMIIYFFGVAEDTSGQTERFLRAAVMGMQSGRIEEIMQIFEDDEKLDQAIKRLEDQGDLFNLKTLKEYKDYQLGMRRKITSPIYNRINDIMGDPHLAKCMKSDRSLDFVEILSQKKVFVFDVPADDLDKIAIDIIVSLLSLKIDLAMRMRKKIKGEEFEFPFFVLIDEPHQFSKSTQIWEDAVVESRKWRICYFWTFHYFEQLPSKLQKAIRNALPHYHLYPTSTATFQQLKDEIYPFTVQEALKLKRWHAINIIRSGGENATPFIAKMTDTPTNRLK
jgi:hypothetical protein